MNYETREIITNSSNSYEANFYDSSNNSSDIYRNSFYTNKNTTTKNLKQVVGLYIQYGIIQGYDSDEIVHLSYFDENPLEPRYYMFGRYLFSNFVL
jgi:hypothetical protein